MLDELRTVKTVKVIGDYLLLLLFDNGEQRKIDLKKFLDGPVFEPVKEISFFNQVFVNQVAGTIAWPNGADIDPEFLYQESIPVD